MPTNEWKLQVKGEEIFPGEVYQAGIGQGYDVVTPIQLVNAYAALANGGRLYQPQLVREIVGPGRPGRHAPFEPKLIREMDVKASVLKDMREAARSVVTMRHTYNLVDLPIVVAGQVRNGRVRDPRPPGPSAVPLVVRRVHAEGPDEEGQRPAGPEGARRRATRSSSSLRSPTTPGRRATSAPRS